MKIILEQDKCIGCGSCANICKKHFKMNKNYKSDLVGGKKTKGNVFEKEIKEVDKETQDAVNSCPAMCIHIK